MDTQVGGYCVPQAIFMQEGSSHTPWREMILKQSKPTSVGEVPYNMLVIFLQFFCLFLFFSLKSIDRHKNPGNATKEKTNVQPRSKNPELRGDVALDCWVFRRGREGQSPWGSWPWETQEEGEATQQGRVVMLTAAR